MPSLCPTIAERPLEEGSNAPVEADDIEAILEEFEAVWAAGLAPRIEDYLPRPDSPGYQSALLELVRIDLERQWNRGDSRAAATYLQRFPALADDSAARSQVVFEEYRQRMLLGQTLNPDDYHDRYGVDVADWPREISVGLENRRSDQILFENAGQTRPVPESGAEASRSRPRSSSAARLAHARLQLPSVGAEFLGFQLLQELGRGAFGVVFLARQGDLANRPVALKISTDLKVEAERLAQLQHTNIMPIYSVHRVGDLQAICMPYFGCATVADLCRTLETDERLPTSGRHIVSTMQQRQSTLHVGSASHASDPLAMPMPRAPQAASFVPAQAAPRQAGAHLVELESMRYVDAVLWMAAPLADGLAHAHARGIIHRDLKPANILLTDDGQPMLLDFNLAEDVKQRTAAIAARVGGTLPFMSPEQLALFADRSAQQDKTPLDGRSDVYSLGLILYQLLTGHYPFPLPQGSMREVLPAHAKSRTQPIPPLRRYNHAVSPAVEAIVLHCLAPQRENRYASAEALKEDITRHLADLPLRHAPNRSWRERAAKWARRHPRLASPVSLAMAGAAVVLLAASVSVALSLEGRKHRQDALRAAAVVQFDQFQKRFHKAEMLLCNDDPEQARQGVKAGLEVLSPYGVLDDAAWSQRSAVADLPAESQVRLTRAVGELAFLLARAPGVQKAGAEQAHLLHNLAGACLGHEAAPLLTVQKAELAGPNSDHGRSTIQRLKTRLQEMRPRTVRFLLASEHTSHGQYREALEILQGLVREAPSQYGVWALKGRCHEQLGDSTEAISCYSTCIALRPDFAQPYVSRAAVVHNSKRDFHLMLADLDQALRLDPHHQAARLDRSLALTGLGRHKEALADLDTVLGHPDAPTRVYFLRADVRERLGDAQGAKEDRAAGLKHEPTDATSWIVRGVARLANDPDGALADFQEAEKRNPRSVDALMNQAYVLGEVRKKPSKALEAIDRLVRNHPDHDVGRATRGVLLARLGRVEEAVAEAKACLANQPRADVRYRVACIYALASVPRPENPGDPALVRASERHLASALLDGWGFEYVLDDDDLAPLRNRPGFGQLLDVVRLLKNWEK